MLLSPASRLPQWICPEYKSRDSAYPVGAGLPAIQAIGSRCCYRRQAGSHSGFVLNIKAGTLPTLWELACQRFRRSGRVLLPPASRLPQWIHPEHKSRDSALPVGAGLPAIQAIGSRCCYRRQAGFHSGFILNIKAGTLPTLWELACQRFRRSGRGAAIAGKPAPANGFVSGIKNPGTWPGFLFDASVYGTSLSSSALSRTAPLSALVASKA